MSKAPSRPQQRNRQANASRQNLNQHRQLNPAAHAPINQNVAEKTPEYRSHAWASSNIARSLAEQELREEWEHSPYHVSTYAGCGRHGKADGPLKEAELLQPSRIAFSALGVLFFTERRHRVRYVTESGEVKTYVGMLGMSGDDDGDRREAKLNRPCGLSFDRFGHLFIADSCNHRIRKVNTSTEKVSTFVGSDEGYADGPIKRARFNCPKDITFDLSHRMIVADSGNNVIRVVSNDTVTTLIGAKIHDGQILSSITPDPFRLFNPECVLFLPSGDLLVCESAHISRILCFSSTGKVTSLLKSSACALPPLPAPQPVRPGQPAPRLAIARASFATVDALQQPFSFSGPCTLSLAPNGHLFLSEAYKNLIYRLSPNNSFDILAGSGKRGHENGHMSHATFGFPSGMASSPLSEDLFICDHDEHRIRKICFPSLSSPVDMTSVLGNFGEISKIFQNSSVPIVTLQHSPSASSWSTCANVLREVGPFLYSPEGRAILDNLPCSEAIIYGILRMAHGISSKDQLAAYMAKLGECAGEREQSVRIGVLLDWCLVARLLGLSYVDQDCKSVLEGELKRPYAIEAQDIWNAIIGFVDRFARVEKHIPMFLDAQVIETGCRQVLVRLMNYILVLKNDNAYPFADIFFSGFAASMALYDKKPLAESLLSEIERILEGTMHLQTSSGDLEHPVEELLKLASERVEVRPSGSSENCGFSLQQEAQLDQHIGDHLAPNFVIESGPDGRGRTNSFHCHDWVLASTWPMVERSLSFGGFESVHRSLHCELLPPVAIRWVLDWIYTGSLPSESVMGDLEDSEIDDAFIALVDNAPFLGFVVERQPCELTGSFGKDTSSEAIREAIDAEKTATTLDPVMVPCPKFHRFISYCGHRAAASPQCPVHLKNLWIRSCWQSKWHMPIFI
jgi:WD40 repeat protein